ncbi:MAG: hypothetical protein KH828_12690 [Clostridiales bacterium]|nr:hypothetical protein [Clostridiales bacterium]
MRNFKKWIWILLFAACVIGANEILNYMLYPYTYTRANLHQMAVRDYQDLVVGSSHGKCGLDPVTLEAKTDHKTLNACQGGEYPIDAYYLVKEASRYRKLSRVIYEVDPGYWVTKPNETADYVTFYHEMPWSLVKAEYFKDKMLECDFRTTLFPWYLYRKEIGRIGENVRQKQSDGYKNYSTEVFKTEVQEYREDGFIRRFPHPGDKGTEDVPVLWNPDELNKDAVEYFDKLAKFCKENGIELVTVMTPVPRETYEKYQTSYEEAAKYFQAVTEEKGIPFYDFLNGEEIGMSAGLERFADYEGHMYEETAVEFSGILGEELVKE